MLLHSLFTFNKVFVLLQGLNVVRIFELQNCEKGFSESGHSFIGGKLLVEI